MQYRISVNGKVFDVTVESVGGSPETPSLAPVAATPVIKPAPVASGNGTDERVLSPMPGNIWEVSVAVGQSVAAGECLIVLESMKMENEVVAPCAGVVKQILVAKGASVETSDVLVVLN
jgi:biotin carboxyl carrier protein